jgi:hypothetical protein
VVGHQTTVRRYFGLALVMCLVSCTGSKPCSPSTCPTGCCDAMGQCQTGSAVNACGQLGATCQNCSIGSTCNFGICVAPSPSGSGGGGGSTGCDGCLAGSTCIHPPNNSSSATCGASGRACVRCSSGTVCNNFTCVGTGSGGGGQGTTSGTAFVAWALPSDSSVTCDYLSGVALTLDGMMILPSVSCTRGLYVAGSSALQGISFSLSPGVHTVGVEAFDAKLTYYRKQSTFNVLSGQTSQQLLQLDWAVGTVALRFDFFINPTSRSSCATAGISEVTLTFRDAQGDLPLTVPCTLNNLDGYTPYVPAGTFQVFANAISSAGLPFTSYGANAPAPPTVTAQPGVFPVLTANSTSIRLYR